MMFLANTAFFTTYIVCQSSARWITVKHESQANFHHGPLRKYPVLHAVHPWVLGWEIGQHEALRGVPCTVVRKHGLHVPDGQQKVLAHMNSFLSRRGLHV